MYPLRHRSGKQYKRENKSDPGVFCGYVDLKSEEEEKTNHHTVKSMENKVKQETVDDTKDKTEKEQFKFFFFFFDEMTT